MLNLHHQWSTNWQSDRSYCQFTYAPQWLTQIGSQATLLQLVQIDVDVMCPPCCHTALARYGERDVLSLVKYLCAHPYLAGRVVYAHIGRVLTVHEEHENAQLAGLVSATKLNNILDALATRDVLALKRYAFSLRILSYLKVPFCDRQGFVLFKDNLHVDDDTRTTQLNYWISKDGERIELTSPFWDCVCKHSSRILPPSLICASHSGRLG